MLMMMLVEQMKSIKVSIMLIILFCIWNLSYPLFISIDGEVWMNVVMNDVMNDEMELMNDGVVMSECGEVWMSDVMNDEMELMNDDEVMSGRVSGRVSEWRSG